MKRHQKSGSNCLIDLLLLHVAYNLTSPSTFSPQNYDILWDVLLGKVNSNDRSLVMNSINFSYTGNINREGGDNA